MLEQVKLGDYIRHLKNNPSFSLKINIFIRRLLFTFHTAKLRFADTRSLKNIIVSYFKFDFRMFQV